MKTKTLLCAVAFIFCCTVSAKGMIMDTIPYTPLDTLPYIPTDTIPNIPTDTIPNIPTDTVPNIPTDTIPNIPTDTIPSIPPDTIPSTPPDTVPSIPTDPEEPQNPPIKILGSDTIFYVKGECLPDTDVSDASLSFRLENNILYIDGTIEANCCGVHHLVFFIMPDSISIQVSDEGELCDCSCLYAVHEQIEGCEGKEYILGFKNKNTGTEKTISLEAEDKTVVPLHPGRPAFTVTQPERNTLCIVTTEGDSFDLKIYDLSGKVLQAMQGKSGEHINITSLPAGAYMLTVNDTAVQKFIKQ